MSGRHSRLLLSRVFLSKNQPSSQKRFQKLAVAEKEKKKQNETKIKKNFVHSFVFAFLPSF